MSMSLNFNSIQYAVEIARRGSFSEAAARLHVSQPALSKAISLLEKQLGVQLFQRKKLPVRTTPEGERFLFYAAELLDTREQMEEEFHRLRQLRQSALCVGVPAYYEFSQISPAVRHFHRLYPHAAVTIREAFSPRELGELLASNQVDFFIRPGVYREEASHCIQLSRERLYLALPEEYGAALPAKRSGESLSLEEFSQLCSTPLVTLPQEVPHHSISLAHCRRAGFSPPEVLTASGIGRVRDLVAAGMGMAFLYSSFLPQEGFRDSSVLLLRCPFDLEERALLACRLPETVPGFLTRQFIDILKLHFQSRAAASAV